MLDLELIITHTNAQTTATLRAELPSRQVDLVEDVPLALDAAALLALSNSPAVYGAALTEMVFVPALLPRLLSGELRVREAERLVEERL